MPSCRITNHTTSPLNISLKQVTALHFENSVQPGQTIKFKPGRVWFTLEAIVDDGSKKSRYSVLKSAATIALLSIAAGAVAATAGAALLPEALAMQAFAAASVAGGMLAKSTTAVKVALVKNSGAIAKLSSVVLPKAVDKLSAEIGGLSALQREVLSIIASPTLSSDVRQRATTLLRSLHDAYSKDKHNTNAGKASKVTASATITPIDEAKDGEKPLPLDPQSVEELEPGRADTRIETTPVRTGEILRVHGIFMDRRREFEIRVGEWGRLELWDKTAKKLIS